MTTSIDEVRESIKKLAETQERGFKEVNQKFKEVDEARRRSLAEVDEARKRSLAEVDQKIKEIGDKISGELGNQWGQFIENVATPNASRLLKDRGIDVQETLTRLYNPSYGEIDSLAINGREAVALEVKKNFKKKHIKKFMEVLALFKKESDLAKNKALYGGIAFLSCEKGVVAEAEAQGLFVIHAFGESATLLNKKDFKPMPITPSLYEKT